MTTLLLTGLALTAAVCASLTAAVIPLLRRARVVDVPGDGADSADDSDHTPFA